MMKCLSLFAIVCLWHGSAQGQVRFESHRLTFNVHRDYYPTAGMQIGPIIKNSFHFSSPYYRPGLGLSYDRRYGVGNNRLILNVGVGAKYKVESLFSATKQRDVSHHNVFWDRAFGIFTLEPKVGFAYRVLLNDRQALSLGIGSVHPFLITKKQRCGKQGCDPMFTKSPRHYQTAIYQSYIGPEIDYQAFRDRKFPLHLTLGVSYGVVDYFNTDKYDAYVIPTPFLPRRVDVSIGMQLPGKGRIFGKGKS